MKKKKGNFCKKAHIKTGKIKRVKKELNVINDINRLRILYLLKTNKELCVNNILRLLNLRQNLVSYHLQVLSRAKLVTRERRGGKIYYKESKKNIKEMQKLIKDLLV